MLFGSVFLHAVASAEPDCDCDKPFVMSNRPIQEKLDALIFSEKTKKRKASDLITVSNVRRLQQPTSLVLVDVRRDEAYQTLHIPGSINIRQTSIKTKTFLKFRQVVLVDQGPQYSGLARLADQLRKAGFQHVSILDGGLSAWAQAKAPLVGDAFVKLSLNRITPEQYFAERHYEHWLVIKISESPSERKFFPGAAYVPYRKNTNAFLKSIKTSIETHSTNNEARYVLLVDKTGKLSLNQVNAINTLHRGQTFILQGGEQAYADYLRQQLAVFNSNLRLAQGPKRKCR